MSGEVTNPLCALLYDKYFSLTAVQLFSGNGARDLRSSTEIFFGKTDILPPCRAYSLAKLNALMSTIVSLSSNILMVLTSL